VCALGALGAVEGMLSRFVLTAMSLWECDDCLDSNV
jgi:hypothetical protein